MKKRRNNLFIIGLLGVFIVGLIMVRNFVLRDENKSDIIDVSNIEVDDKFLAQMNEKELLQYKVLNSIDFYKSVEGILSSGNKSTNESEITKFVIDIKNKRAYYNQKSDEQNNETIINDGKRIIIDNNKKEYRSDKINYFEKDNIFPRLKPNQRFFGEKKIKVKYKDEIREVTGFAYREDGYLIQIKNLFDQEILSHYMHDLNWDIEKKTQYLDRDAIQIKGEMDLVDKYGASVFRAIIDEETGVILSMEYLDKKGDIIIYDKITEINFNLKATENVFNIDLKNYKRVN